MQTRITTIIAFFVLITACGATESRPEAMVGERVPPSAEASTLSVPATTATPTTSAPTTTSTSATTMPPTTSMTTTTMSVPTWASGT